MDPFSYLSVLLSIILGLGITHVLTAFARLIRGRAAVTPYWPPLVWAGVLLVIYVQVWWTLFDLRERTTWTFLEFLVVLLQTIALYMAAAVVLPEGVPESDAGERARVDLREHYERQRRWFFGFIAGAVVVSMVKELILEGRLPEPVNLGFHIFLLAMSAAAIVVRRRWFHEANAVVGAVTFAVYIALLFSRLR